MARVGKESEVSCETADELPQPEEARVVGVGTVSLQA